jgi:hypothetical protein
MDTASASENVLAVLAAAKAAELGPRLPMNLLPVERRAYESTAAMVPTLALASLIVLLAIAVGLRGSVQDWVYGRRLERERQSLAPQIQQIERLQGSSRDKMAHLAALARFQQSGALPLGMLDELTRILPADAWLQQLQYEGNTVTLSGTAQSASAVLQARSASSHLSRRSSHFADAKQRWKEVFRTGARLRAPIRKRPYGAWQSGSQGIAVGAAALLVWVALDYARLPAWDRWEQQRSDPPTQEMSDRDARQWGCRTEKKSDAALAAVASRNRPASEPRPRRWPGGLQDFARQAAAATLSTCGPATPETRPQTGGYVLVPVGVEFQCYLINSRIFSLTSDPGRKSWRSRGCRSNRRVERTR